MKTIDNIELEKLEVDITPSDEFGIYFVAGGKRKLAFTYETAKKAISSVRKIKDVLGIQYNINTKAEVAALNEQKQKQSKPNKSKKEIRTMANKKRDVNVKGLCRECFDQNMEKEAIIEKIAAVYTEEGKDKDYAVKRAKAVYSSIRKERGLAPEKKGPKKKIEVVVEKEEVEKEEVEKEEVEKEEVEKEEVEKEEVEEEVEYSHS